MVRRSIPKGVVKDIIIVVIGVLIIALGLHATLGTGNPFYVVASGSMIPVLQVYDVLIVQGDCFDLWGTLNYEDCIKFSWYTPFEDIEVGDIIVFDRPSDHNRVIVHRVVSIMEDNPKVIRTQGDANAGSIPGTDYPITEEEYIGKVAYTVPQIGYITQLLKPPINYVIIAIVVGIMIVKQFVKKKNEKELSLVDPLDSENPNTVEELSDINEIEKDSEYSEHIGKADDKKLEDVKKEENIEKSIEEKIKDKELKKNKE